MITVNNTAVSFLVISIGIALCGFWFLKAFFRESNGGESRKIGLLLGAGFLSSAGHNFLLGIAALLFLSNNDILFVLAGVAHLLLVVFSVFSVYAFFYVLYPNSNAYLVTVLPVVIGLLSLFLYFTENPQPFLTLGENSVNWDLSYALSVSTFYLFFFALGAFFILFIQLSRTVKSFETKILAYVIAALALIGIINVYFALVFFYDTGGFGGFSNFDFLNMGLVVVGVVFMGLMSYLRILKR